MDDLGRWVVASDGVWTLGDAVGPGIGGFLVERSGYTPLGSLALFTGVTCIVVMVEVMRRFHSGQGRPSADARAAPDGGRFGAPRRPPGQRIGRSRTPCGATEIRPRKLET